MGGRGRRHPTELRLTLISLIKEAVSAGARQHKACQVVGISVRTLQRWQNESGGTDDRQGPKTPVAHAFTIEEKDEIIRLVNLPENRNLYPEVLVAKFADEGFYISSESTIRRVLAEYAQDTYRGRSKPQSKRAKPTEYVATGPLMVLSWDITYLRQKNVKGAFYFLYLYVDVWSRRILGWAVHDEQSTELAAELLRRICIAHDIEANTAVLHQDNGTPMKGATFLATMDALGITKSFSRPRVSDDNPFIEALFRHLKYAPNYPKGGFASLDAARQWVTLFVDWYNNVHRHSAIGYVTPIERHNGDDIAILQQRRDVYQAAQQHNPKRWTKGPRKWDRPVSVTLNPDRVITITPAVTEIAPAAA